MLVKHSNLQSRQVLRLLPRIGGLLVIFSAISMQVQQGCRPAALQQNTLHVIPSCYKLHLIVATAGVYTGKEGLRRPGKQKQGDEGQAGSAGRASEGS